MAAQETAPALAVVAAVEISRRGASDLEWVAQVWPEVTQVFGGAQRTRPGPAGSIVCAWALDGGDTLAEVAALALEWSDRIERMVRAGKQRVRERLTEMLRGRSVWPSAAEFAAAGERSLLAAARRLGGIDRWATEVGLQPPPHTTRSSGRRKPGTWNDAEILGAILPLVDELGRWPTKSESHRAGLSSALAAVYDHGGSVVWQRRVGLSPRSYAGPVPDRTLWIAQRIEAELRDFCQARSGWPTLNEFDAAGLGSPYRAASHRGGIATWRQRLGFW